MPRLGILAGMELLLAGLVILGSLLLAAWQERPATRPSTPSARRGRRT